jgi:orotate phosphoribosyltransferase
MSLFQLGDFTLASGKKSHFKIDCDFLCQDDWQAIAALLAERIPCQFGSVEGVPTGGLALEQAMQAYCIPGEPVTLLVDDVWTTGGSMWRQRGSRVSVVWGAVVFARTEVPAWVTPLFRMTKG